MTLNLKSSNTTSAPASPAKGVSSFLSRATSLTGSVTNTVQQIARVTSQAAAAIKDRHKILLVIDNPVIDWSKYFRGKRLFGDWDIKVEQAEFKDIILSSHSELGTVVSIQTLDRNSLKIARTFRPDFVLIRQHIRDSNEDYSDIILGLKYGLVPSINSLHSLYNFQDNAWVFANLISIQRKQGKEAFPLIEQTIYSANKDMNQIPKFPCVVKIGKSHSGLGKAKVENLQQFQDIRSILVITKAYCTIEPFIEAKCDLHVQKIGNNYKAFTRKSVSGNWKANVGSAVLEQVPVIEKYKKWFEDISTIFEGLDICSVEAIIDKEGKEYIIEVCGSTMSLLGESQEEDRRNIADLIIQKMNIACKSTLIKQQSRNNSISSHPEFEPNDQVNRAGQRASITSLNQSNQQVSSQAAVNPIPSAMQPNQVQQVNQIQSVVNRRSSKETIETLPNAGVTFNENNPFANLDQTANLSNQEPSKPVLTKRDSQSAIDDIKEEVDDTMRNLRKTFAGIFGDM